MDDLETPHDTATRLAAYAEVERLAEWSGWGCFPRDVALAPRLPGVYLFRAHDSGRIRYVGRAGERGGRSPQGLHGRLAAYRTGQGPVSGFSEAALDEALADPAWVTDRLRRLAGGRPERTRVWAREAMVRLAPDLSWVACADADDARQLEVRVGALLRRFGLWGR